MIYRSWIISIIVGCFAAAVTSVCFLDLCNLIYRCGCDHLWGAQAAHCNIHNPAGKHCPWCSVGMVGYGILYGGIVLVQLILGFFPRRWSWQKRLAAALIAFPVLGGLEGLVMGLYSGYWS